MLLTTPRLLFALAVAGTGLAAAVPSAEAAYPGTAGKIVYADVMPESGFSQIVVANPDGTGQTPITTIEADHQNPVWSPDGTRIAYQQRAHGDAQWDILVYDTTTGETVEAVDFPGNQSDATWSPDGRWIAYEQGGDLYKALADGSSTEPQLVLDADGPVGQPAWSAQDMLAFVADGGERHHIYAMPAQGGEWIDVATKDFDNRRPDWSPDGKQIVYEADEAVFVTDVGTDVGTPYHQQGWDDTDPVFAPDGSRLLWASERDWQDFPGRRLWIGTNRADAADAAPIDPLHLRTAMQPDWQPLVGPALERPRQETPAPRQQPGPVVSAPAAPVVTPRAAKAASRQCASKRVFRIRVKRSRGDVVAKARVVVNGKAVKVKKLDRVYATVDLRKLPRGAWDVEITATMKSGKVTRDVRRYRTCAPKAKRRA